MADVPNVQEKRPASHGVLPWILLTLAVVLGFFLLSEHRAHLFGVLPYLLLLLCPLMHVFMHHGHGTRAHADRDVRP